MSLALAIAMGVLLDRLLGEPRRGHPLVGFGRLADWLEARLNHDHAHRLTGALALVLMLAPPIIAVALLRRAAPTGLIDALAVYFALGARALNEHAMAIARPLCQGDIHSARAHLAYIVSRDTRQLDEAGVAGASVESVLENGNDAIFAALFWAALGGAPAVVMFRLANTLDAMWGYRTPRFERFGWAAARLDDLLNYLPARLTAASYALFGHTRLALRCWREQAPAWSSPNAGPVMAAGAGSLGLALGGAAIYHGAVELRPPLGHGRPARAEDIASACRLVQRSLVLWVVVIICGGALCWLIP